ncbi:MAG TPA: LysM domain-containing protein [Solirubrobacterales bacterium]|nr:LysM domain-containing protein [Solirubrobacterales bacterium]
MRLLAPIAIIVVAAAVLFVVATSIPDSNSDDGNRGGGGRGGGGGKGAKTERTEGKFYTVEPGDSLTSIADKTGVPVERLLLLNPNLDPQALISGERVKLRR